MRRFLITDTRKDPPHERSDTLAGVIVQVEMTDIEVDELADLEVSGSITIDNIRIKRTE
jgi:hypothetical protein